MNCQFSNTLQTGESNPKRRRVSTIKIKEDKWPFSEDDVTSLMSDDDDAKLSIATVKEFNSIREIMKNRIAPLGEIKKNQISPLERQTKFFPISVI